MCTAANVTNKCREFLAAYFGTQNEVPDPALNGLGLRLVCLGNPEKTIQGELVHFLRQSGINAVSECGVVGEVRRSLDVVVFDGGWQPLCVIELKHYSANQGSLATLARNLRGDQKRHAEALVRNLPLVQIGLYTDICSVRPEIPVADQDTLQHGLYRFLKTYYHGERNCGNVIKGGVEAQLVSPAQNSITINDQHVVAGRVHYILN